MWQLLLGLSAAQLFQQPLTLPRAAQNAQVVVPQNSPAFLAANSFSTPTQRRAPSGDSVLPLALCVAAPVAALAYYFGQPTSAPRTAAPVMAAGLAESLGTKAGEATSVSCRNMYGMVVPTGGPVSAGTTAGAMKKGPKLIGLGKNSTTVSDRTKYGAVLPGVDFVMPTAPKSAPTAPVTKEEVLACQAAWANGIKAISKVYKDGGDFVEAAANAASELYGYGHGTNVLFKPTKALDERFRPSGASAMSYFVGNANVEGGIAEDGGFAINGGRGWSDVVFKNHQIDLNGSTAIAMGTYDFTDATDGSKTTVEYTFGYKKNEDGKVRIFLHHSSVPYSPGPKLAPVTEAEVREVQSKWASAIASISKVHKDGGDYIAAASAAAGELYAYGHDNVLFKPTKAAEFQFRPTAEEAMSYFVGGDVVEGGYAEDAGFAINGGKGWESCVYDNHQIDLNGSIAIAMGNYYFTDATDGGVVKVEYTFGYKRCEDGKVRICLHHSSVPYSA